MLYFALFHLRPRRRHPDHRQPQPGRRQRLQDLRRPLDHPRRRDPGAAPARSRRARARDGTGRLESVDIAARYLAYLIAQHPAPGAPDPGRRRRRQRHRRPGRARRSSARSAAPSTRSTASSTAASRTTTPTRRSRNLHDLIARVRATGAEVGLAFDGDADRLGVVDRDGPHRLGRPAADPLRARRPARPTRRRRSSAR